MLRGWQRGCRELRAALLCDGGCARASCEVPPLGQLWGCNRFLKLTGSPSEHIQTLSVVTPSSFLSTMAASTPESVLARVSDGDGSDLVGVVVVERDAVKDCDVAWSYPDPGAQVEHAATALGSWPSMGIAVETFKAGDVWLYR